MINVLKCLFNLVYRFHRIISKDTNSGLKRIGIVFLFIALVPIMIIYLLAKTNIYEEVIISLFKIYGVIMFCLTIFLIQYYQITLLILKTSKNKRITKTKFYSNTNYLLYCTKTSIIILAPFVIFFDIFLKFNAVKYIIMDVKILMTIFSILYSFFRFSGFHISLYIKYLMSKLLR